MAAKWLPAHAEAMKPGHKHKPLTLGELIESAYRACGKRRARAVLRLAAKARLLVFPGPGPAYDFLAEE
jgi:hypothetical protein